MEPLSARAASGPAAWILAPWFLGFAAAACLLAGWAPVGFSICTVFLFAGPHNWMEARYFMTRMPARWGRLRMFFLSGISGVVLLSAASLALPSVARSWSWGAADWLTGLAVWNTLLVLWIMWMIELRGREKPESPWRWTVPAGLAVIALAWLQPVGWSLALVFVHPLVALWFVDRELGRHRGQWQSVYRKCLLAVPLLLGALWWRLAGTPHLPGRDLLTMQINTHAGADIVPGVSSHLLVSTHVFLEMLHYAAWIVAIPLIAYRGGPWKLSNIPLMRKSRAWQMALLGVLALGLLLVVALWAGLLANYPLTRDIYFSAAILHVLAEVPFLLRLL